MKSTRAEAKNLTETTEAPKFRRKTKVAAEMVEVSVEKGKKGKKAVEPSYEDYIQSLVNAVKGSISSISIPRAGLPSLVEVSDWIPMPEAVCEVMGTPGLPCGHIVEIMGAPDCGKTTLVTHALIEAQKKKGIAILLDTEHKFNLKRAIEMGLDRKTLIVIRCETIEQAFNEFVTILKRIASTEQGRNRHVVVAWDSIGATPCKKEIEAEGENFAADSAKALKGGLRRTRYFLSQTKACLLLINQTYEDIGGKTFFKKKKGYGGSGPEYFSTIILSLSRLARLSKKVKGETVKFGIHTQIEATKNHLAPPFRQVRVDIDAKGIVYGGRKAGDDA